MANKIQIRRGVEEDLPVLSAGEFGLCTDTGNVYIGTGDGNVLVTIDGDALQANIDALEESGVKNPKALTLTLNGSGTDYDGSEAASKAWYAPTSVAGGAGYELVAGGTATTSVPVWKAPSYGVCSTAAATPAKTVSCTNFKLVTGVHMTVKFTYSHTSSTAATLNVGETGAKTIYNGMTGNTVTSGNGSWAAGEIVEFVYDGTYWRAVSSSGYWLCALKSIVPVTSTLTVSKTEDSNLKVYFAEVIQPGTNYFLPANDVDWGYLSADYDTVVDGDSTTYYLSGGALTGGKSHVVQFTSDNYANILASGSSSLCVLKNSVLYFNETT